MLVGQFVHMCANRLDVFLDEVFLLFCCFGFDVVEIGRDGRLGVDDEIAVAVEFYFHVGDEAIAVLVGGRILCEEVRSGGFQDLRAEDYQLLLCRLLLHQVHHLPERFRQ